MTRRASALVLVVAVAAVFAAATALLSRRESLLDMSRVPETVFATIPFPVGGSYTLGSMTVPSDVARPVRITSIEVVASSGVELIGMGAFDPASVSEGIGLVSGWPPAGLTIVDPTAGAPGWTTDVAIVIGIRTTDPKSGLRGVVVRWVDGAGQEGQRVFDLAVLTCAPGACSVDPSEPGPMLTELGLKQ